MMAEPHSGPTVGEGRTGEQKRGKGERESVDRASITLHTPLTIHTHIYTNTPTATAIIWTMDGKDMTTTTQTDPRHNSSQASTKLAPSPSILDQPVHHYYYLHYLKVRATEYIRIYTITTLSMFSSGWFKKATNI